MKKIFYLMSLCALAFISCQKEEIAGNGEADGKYTYTFTVNNTVEAKANIGDKSGTQWPVLWEKGDKLGVYDVLTGDLLGTADLKDESAGKNSGTFVLNTDAMLTDGDDLYFAYPYVEGATMRNGKIAAKQTISSVSVGANALAYAEAKYKAAGTEFTLTHANAYLKFNIASSEYGGYDLNGITLWAAGSELSGDAAVAADGALTVTGAGDYVKTTLAEPVKVSTTAQPLWLTALPGNLSGKTVYAIVHMTKGIETITLPVKLNGAAALPAGSVTEITLPALTKSLAPAWYEPKETRYIAAYGEGWSYGPENTVLFTATGQEKTVELKARGNFMKVQKPAKVKMNNISDQNGMAANGIFLNSTDGSTAGVVSLDANCSVKVKMNALSSYGYFGNMLVQNEAGKTIWGINLWLSTDGVNAFDYNGGKVLDRNIGSSKVSSVKKHYTCNGAYFQWGRPFGFPWSTSNKGTSLALTDNTNTLEKSAENPFVMYCYSNGGNGDGYPWDWYWGDGNNRDRSGDLDDLWGNPQSGKTDVKTSGSKTIYDPCPIGYRVASPEILYEVSSNIDAEYGTDGTFTTKGATNVNTDSANHHYLEYKGVSWGFGGQFRPLNGAWGKAGDGKIQYLAFWSNANNSQNGYELYFQMKDSKITRSDSRTKAAAAPVRCMVDTENR